MIQLQRMVLGIGTLGILAGPGVLAAQRPHPVGAQPPVTFPDTSTDRAPVRNPNSCPGRRVAVVGLNSVGGALAGFIGWTITIGALADDHGEIYQRHRRRWTLDGAAIGTGVGLFRALTRACDELFDGPPNRRLRALNASPPS